MSNQRQCIDCRKFKPTSEFTLDRIHPPKFSPYCRPCKKLRNARSYRERKAAEGKTVKPYNPQHPQAAILQEAGMKFCNTCKKIKPLDKFPNSKRTKNGKYSVCSACNTVRRRLYD
jgi:hypothetical protein